MTNIKDSTPNVDYIKTEQLKNYLSLNGFLSLNDTTSIIHDSKRVRFNSFNLRLTLLNQKAHKQRK